MSKALKTTFLIHAVVAVVFGLLLLIIPGRILVWMNWAPIDPIISRLLGAALLALAWSSFRGWRATDSAQVEILVEVEAVLTVLGSVALLRHLLFATYPPMVWGILAIYLAFAIAWIFFLYQRRR